MYVCMYVYMYVHLHECMCAERQKKHHFFRATINDTSKNKRLLAVKKENEKRVKCREIVLKEVHCQKSQVSVCLYVCMYVCVRLCDVWQCVLRVLSKCNVLDCIHYHV